MKVGVTLTAEETTAPLDVLCQKATRGALEALRLARPDLVKADVHAHIGEHQRGGELQALTDVVDLMNRAYARRTQAMLEDIAREVGRVR